MESAPVLSSSFQGAKTPGAKKKTKKNVQPSPLPSTSKINIVAENILWQQRIATENGGDDLWVKNWGMLYDHEEVELSTQISELHTELAAMDDAIAAAQSDVKTRCDSVRKAQRKK